MNKKAQGLYLRCDSCNAQIGNPGGLIFVPLKENLSQKIHLCLVCTDRIHSIIQSTDLKGQEGEVLFFGAPHDQKDWNVDSFRIPRSLFEELNIK